MVISLIASGLLLLTMLFQWSIIEALTVFLGPLLIFAVWVGFAIVFVWSLVNVFLARREPPRQAYGPLGVNLLAAVLAVFVPFTQLTLELDYRLNYSRRVQVVQKVATGDLNGSRSRVPLPEDLKGVSVGGDILIDRRGGTTKVFFFTFRGLLDNFSGFVHTSDGKPPKPTDFGGDLQDVVPRGNGWFFVTSA